MSKIRNFAKVFDLATQRALLKAELALLEGRKRKLQGEIQFYQDIIDGLREIALEMNEQHFEEMRDA